MRPRSFRPAPAFRHCGAHLADALGEADEDRFANQEVADVEFDELRDRGDRPRGVVVDAVAGVDTRGRATRDRAAATLQPAEFVVAALAFAARQRVALGAGVQLDHLRAKRGGGLERLGRRLDEQRDANAGARLSSATNGLRWS